MKTEVRKFAMILLKRKSKNSPFCLPSKAEFTRFEMRKIGGPTRKNFRVQLIGSLACQWNRRAADVFSKAYIKKKGPQFKHEDLVRCFKTHLRTLKNQCDQIKAGCTKNQGDIDRRSTSARRTRRQGLAQRRGEVLAAYEELRAIAPHLNMLGVDGMSGDESDHSGGHRRYVIRKISWRSDEVTSVLRVLDALALVAHWSRDGRPRPGKFPHARIASDRTENREPVRNLPRNFYRSDWLDALDKYERRELNIGAPIELALPSRVLSLAHRYKNASDPQRPPLPSGGVQSSASKPCGMGPGGRNSKKKRSTYDRMDVDG
ncbi:hypothetical protein BC826DRAFT_955745 [Russula brevipes]|nr:hypothetical protein BC826DRAFT_955745 [Russula brevipes]